VIAKDFICAKDLRSYWIPILRQEKSLRDHGGNPGLLARGWLEGFTIWVTGRVACRGCGVVVWWNRAGSGMPDLRISDIPSGGPGAGRRVKVEWQDGHSRRAAVSSVSPTQSGPDGELIRWYLEDYAESPADPAPTLAASAEALLARDGAELFRRVFSGPDAAGIWERARDCLREVRVEIDADPGEGPGIAWELLRDPSTDTAVALGAGAFVRTHLQAAAHPDRVEPSGDRLRVLLVICRPGGQADVPFRSVASRLVRGGADRMQGLDLDVLRPATFARLSQVLRAAKAAGRPYHVVHFDGHGTYLDVADLDLDANGKGGGGGSGSGSGSVHGAIDVSPLRYGVTVAGPVRAGQHGYLLFEAPTGARSAAGHGRAAGGMENVQLVDGPTLGRLLTEAGVPVLVLNACRSAYAEARPQPARSGPEESSQEDVHSRIRAYGSLAAEVADAGVPGVVAMRYNVYVVTAAQFVADLYAQLLAGRPLGEAVTAARRGLADDPNRQIGPAPVALQDWAVPVVYESAPLVLLRPADRIVPTIRLTADNGPGPADNGRPWHDGGRGAGAAPDGVPRAPDAGFFGRDETLLALDRAFDEQRLVLLHGYAGAGKSSTAAEFARWYEATGGLDDPEHPEWGAGPVLWSSFEHHLTADRAIGMAGDHFAGLLEANGIAWAAITDPSLRRELVVQTLRQIPVLWIWDNVEPVSGFPAGTTSTWTPAEQDELVDLLRDITQQTCCQVLLTSRRDERGWMGDLPARVGLPPMPMRESLQLATAIAARRRHPIVAADWRPLLRFAAGNPLTITVVTGQALRENLITAEQIDRFVRRLQAGEAQPESGGDAALGRTRSLAASLDYGFEQAFTDAERAQLAVLHLFCGTVAVPVLLLMGNPDVGRDGGVPELAGLDVATTISMLDRAAEIGLLSSLGGGFYHIHPALPWYFTAMFTGVYGAAGDPAADRAARAYAISIGMQGSYGNSEFHAGRALEALGRLQVEEANLLHGLELARACGIWDAIIGCLQGLNVLYERTGRTGEWGRLIADIVPDVTDGATGAPLAGRAEQWSAITEYRVRLADNARDWPTATALLSELLAWRRDQAAEALSVPAASMSSDHRHAIHNLVAALNRLGIITSQQGSGDCVSPHQEALALIQLIGDRPGEAQQCGDLGNVYLQVPELLDLDEAERWFRRGLALRADGDRLGRSKALGSLSYVAIARFHEARSAGQGDSVLLGHLDDALRGYSSALELLPADDHESRQTVENQLGIVYGEVGDIGNALPHFQRAIQHCEAAGELYAAGQTRHNVAILLADADRAGEALHYARAALDNYQRVGPSAASAAAQAEQFIARLQQGESDTTA
jgi:tetratricopeptide (TPR) repeat protein